MQKIPELSDFYRHLLLEEIAPKCAAALSDTVNDEVSAWSAMWLFSKLYNRIEKRVEWLEVACRLTESAGRKPQVTESSAECAKLSQEGVTTASPDQNVLGRVRVAAAAISGLTEFALATGQQGPLERAVAAADEVLHRLAISPRPPNSLFRLGGGSPAPPPCAGNGRGGSGDPPRGSHAVPMLLSPALWALGRVLKEDRYAQAALRMQEEIFTCFYRKDRDLLLERISADGTELPPPEGTLVVPGSVMRSMWSQIHIARDRHDRRLLPKACDIILRHLEIGWDNQAGGLFLSVDADSGAPRGNASAERPLWPQAEALYASLLAYEHTGEKWALQRHEELRQYCLKNVLSPPNGWNLQEHSAKPAMGEAVGVLVNDAFALPRSLIHCIDALERLREFI